ncbi:MAG: 3-phosphoshikimate 1-carboxyvinyltransferase [Candidatus Caenarcaniphilales bacterium]|nr:3-phosphoshikimate 1-carboxyvinyltransferase [Candidatus Caenarcaniphilales bacterium]
MKTLNPLFTKSLNGSITVPSDKSIAQRAIMLSAVASGTSFIKNFPLAGDPQSTLNVVSKLGVQVDIEKTATGNNLTVLGKGFEGLIEPSEVLDVQNSGTGLRLMMGLLAGNPNGLFAVLTGDESLRKRPMKRVADPLRKLGAQIFGRQNGELAPLCVQGRSLSGGSIETSVASAQLKSALILAGLNAQAPLTVKELETSRNHTEIMLQTFGASLEQIDSLTCRIHPSKLIGCEINIPGDFSSACFFLVAGLIVPNSKIKIANVGLNPTRTAALEVLLSMGGKIKTIKNASQSTNTKTESTGDLEVEFSSLKAIEIKGSIIPNLIDEIPILCLAAAQAKGTTIISDAQELRVKESDRLKAMFKLLDSLGVKVQEKPDGLIIEGSDGNPFEPKGNIFEAGHDHRIAMTAGIASLICNKPIQLNGSEWANVSFPGFFELLDKLSNETS